MTEKGNKNDAMLDRQNLSVHMEQQERNPLKTIEKNHTNMQDSRNSLGIKILQTKIKEKPPKNRTRSQDGPAQTGEAS